MYPRCTDKNDYLGWHTAYNMASNKQKEFPAAMVDLGIEGKKTRIAIGVSKFIGQDMLMARDIPHFRHYLKKELEVELKEKPDRSSEEVQKKPTPPVSTGTEAGIVVAHAKQCQQDAFEEEERLRQEKDGPLISALDPVDSGVQAEGTEDFMTKEGQARCLEGAR